MYGCQGGTGTVELRAGRSTGTLLASITITVRTPPTPRGELSATKTAIDVGEEVTVSAVNVSPSGQSVYIVTNGQLDFARHGSCHVETGPRSSTRSARSWSLIGCSPAGSGSVTLKTRHNGNTVVLDSITIDVSMPPTPTPTPTVTPRGELSATKTAVDVGEEVTVRAVNVSPSGQSVYIVTNGQLDFARPGTCHFEINPRSSEKSAKSWTLEGCSPPGSGSVTLKTRHNGQTLVLDSITIDVSDISHAHRTRQLPYPRSDLRSDPRSDLRSTEPTVGPTTEPTTGPTTEPTDTPSPTPTLPTGWITAAPMKIIVGQTTTITATWNNVASTPKLSFGPQLAERCAGIQGQGVQGRSVLDTELVAKATQTLTGCTAGTVTVKLLDGSTELDAVTVAVVAKPSIQATRRIGYRWFNIGWTAARALHELRHRVAQ